MITKEDADFIITEIIKKETLEWMDATGTSQKGKLVVNFENVKDIIYECVSERRT